jgi:hypothetical protein
MAGSDHTSRTLLLSKKAPGMIIINRGSNSNIDPLARDITTGHSQIKAFNLTNLTSSSSSSSSAAEPYDFNTAGLLLGWGLRNDVGIAEEPQTGGIYSVENSADQITRDDIDIHTDNPAEELNFLGYLDGTFSPNQGRNFGYPTCFTAWNTSAIPNFSGTTTVGAQFTIGKRVMPYIPPSLSLSLSILTEPHARRRLQHHPQRHPLLPLLLLQPTPPPRLPRPHRPPRHPLQPGGDHRLDHPPRLLEPRQSHRI